MAEFNNIGISSELDWPRIKKLLTIGLSNALLNCIADMLLGWGTENETLSGIPRLLSTYAQASDARIIAAAILGLIAIFLDGLALFGIYRLIVSRSEKDAHTYRTGIIGYLVFGPCGFHVPACAGAYLYRHLQSAQNVDVASLITNYALWFIAPATALFFIFFIVLAASQIRAFYKEHTPYPRWCWIFNPALGAIVTVVILNIFGNQPWANALSCAWISIGFIWTFGGLLATMKLARD